MANITRRTLHFYEEIGLLVPSGKSTSGQRLYSAEQIRQLEFITQLKELGLPLSEIKELLKVRERHPTAPKSAAEETISFINTVLPKVGDQLKSLSQLQTDLLVGREILRTCAQCTRCADRDECRKCDHLAKRESLPAVIQEMWL